LIAFPVVLIALAQVENSVITGKEHSMTKGKNDGAKKRSPREKAPNGPQNALIPADAQNPTVSRPGIADFTQSRQVSQHVGSLLGQCQASEAAAAAAAIVPWFCDALSSAKHPNRPVKSKDVADRRLCELSIFQASISAHLALDEYQFLNPNSIANPVTAAHNHERG
jgi:hypothetical protein